MRALKAKPLILDFPVTDVAGAVIGSISIALGENCAGRLREASA